MAIQSIIDAMNDPFDNLDIDSLPADVRAVLLAERKALMAERKTLMAERAARMIAEKRAEQFKETNSQLEYLLAEFKRALFGKKSEKINDDQLQLAFEELEAALAETQTAQAETQGKSGASDKPRKPPKRNLGRLPIELPRIENIIEPESTLCPCGCGKQMIKIGEDRSERLDILPAQFRVIVTIRPI